MRWKTKRQRSRDNNINMQAERIHLGLGYRDVKEISHDTAMEVFEKNFHNLSQLAYSVARGRAEEFTSNLIEVVQQRTPNALETFQDPGTQAALFSAQSGYAKTGDADLGEVLIELLMTRISASVRDTSQLASAYAVTVAENLSSHHFAILTCSFILKQLSYRDVRSTDSLARQMLETIDPFVDDLNDANSVDLDYLTGLGCMIATSSTMSPGRYTGLNYPGLFTVGFSSLQKDTNRLIGTPLVRPFGPESDRYKIAALTKSELMELVDRVVMHDMRDLALQTLQDGIMHEREIERILCQEQEALAPIFARCSDLGINSYINTAIGTAIAHANMRRVHSGFDVSLTSLLSENPPR
ncbi:LPO_1073/Vpar_1526 family protein [Streptomyces werraensis]|uniref:LPO_1073/Vpar_1526 family protein n=1 Tax=Streptomyces werraensis TaxID=68284 RepID=UPI00307D3569